jgi:hypothetical protein
MPLARRTRICPRCERRTAAPDCCGIVFAARRRWRMTKALVQRVHIVARAQKGLDEETYRLRLQSVGVESSKRFTREQYHRFMRELAKLPDVRPRAIRAGQGRAA